MTHRVRSAFGRFLALGAVVALATFVAVAPAAAQQTTGKVEGTVSDQAGVALASAQVFVVGTSFGAVTNEKGYYFINNVPVGSYTLRAQFIGYAPTEVRDVRVLGGQTMTQDIKLSPSAIQVSGLTVTAAANPIVPRDQVASKSIVAGATINSLPVDDVRNVISLQPGVVESGSGSGVSIRGGRPGEQNVYIDGAPVRSTNFGSQSITVGTNAVEEASVTTGALGVEFGDAQSGIISYTTRAGGQNLAGSLNYQTDEPFGNSISVGFNRFEGSLGGPIPMINNLRFFVSSVVQGQTSRFRGTGFDKIPTFTLGGVDTTVTDNDGNVVDVPNFVQFGGTCDASKNFGQDCQGRRAPFDWTDDIKLQGKLSYSYGSGSSIALTGIASGQQGRNTPGSGIGNPNFYTGFHNWQRLYVLNMTHSFFKSAERELAINVNLSLGQDRGVAGGLDSLSELDSRDPSLGLRFKSLGFYGVGAMPFPLTDQIIRN
ncbi:MAG: carboxypeptidase regulatory-like domain-containing protein, partial [Gemmatimonadota bacterium]